MDCVVPKKCESGPFFEWVDFSVSHSLGDDVAIEPRLVWDRLLDYEVALAPPSLCPLLFLE